MTTRPDRITIQTKALCSCGRLLIAVRYDGDKDCAAFCPDCFEPVEDAPERATIQGFGLSVRDAVWDWTQKHEAAIDLTWWPVSLDWQVESETKRQRGWVLRDGVWGPPVAMAPAAVATATA